MRLIKVSKNSNGSHVNMIGDFDIVPDGFAVIPDDLETPNFPFGKITSKKINGVKTVTSWEALPIPVDENKNPTIDERLKKLENFIDKITERLGL